VLVNRAVRRGLDHLLAHGHVIVVLVDEQGRPAAANPAFERLRQRSPSAGSLTELVLPGHHKRLADMIALAHGSRSAIREQVNFGVPGAIVRCDCVALPVGRGATLIVAEPALQDSELIDTNARLEDDLAAVRAALDLKAAELQAVVAQADELAHTDSLTLLPNRRSIIADLQHQVTYAERYNTPLAITMLDLDGFKAVNDQLGHSVGDQVLGSVARGLRDRIRQPDVIGRYGGDEFLVILPNSTGAAASEQASRLCQFVRSTPLPPIEGFVTRLTLSAGITHFSPGDDDWRALIDRADRALYEAKRQGGDRWLILES
jgi:diguanylate cyclase (GGDEF)-like protein